MSDYEILAIEPGYADRYFEAANKIQELVASTSPETLAQAYEDDEKKMSHPLSLNEDVAVINVKGMLTNETSFWNRYVGRVSYDEIREATAQAIDEEVGAIVYLYDTPGGAVNGMADAASMISSLPMPTISFAVGNMASAGYFLGSQADEVISDSFSSVGSIGIMIRLMSRAKMLKGEGIEAYRFRSGDLKGSGDPNFSLTKREKDYFQGRVKNMAEMFYQIVTDARGIPRDMLDEFGITSGRTFIGIEAKAVSLVDDVMSFDQSLIKAYDLAKKYLDKRDVNSLGYKR